MQIRFNVGVLLRNIFFTTRVDHLLLGFYLIYASFHHLILPVYFKNFEIFYFLADFSEFSWMLQVRQEWCNNILCEFATHF